jgi:hypothetical protein
MSTNPSPWIKLFLAGLCLSLVVGVGQEGVGQTRQGQYPSSQEQQRQPGAQAQESNSLIHGVTVAAGLAIYQGDFSLNPSHNLVKYIAGNGKLSLRVGADHRLGRFDQYGLGADLVYSRLSGETTNEVGFKSNSVALDLYADYELPYIYEGLFRVFVGGGPNLIISPSYTGTPRVSKEENYQRLGTRVTGSLKVGVTILDSFRIGTRISSTDLLDGYKGFVSDGVPDFVSFLNIGYRIDLE